MAHPRDRVALDRFPPHLWITTFLILLTVVYAVLQIGFVRPHLPADPAPSLARPPASAATAEGAAAWRERYPGVEELKVAVMGCIVNGPGESKHADIGISLTGTGETPTAPVFIDGRKAATLRGPGIAEEFQKMVADYVEQRFGHGRTEAAE